MELSISMTIEHAWEHYDADGSTCQACEEQIFSKKHSLVYTLNKIDRSVVCSVCDSCYNMLIEK